jgi:hypothetical protein
MDLIWDFTNFGVWIFMFANTLTAQNIESFSDSFLGGLE